MQINQNHVTVLPTIDEKQFAKLYQMLNNINIPYTTSTSSRRGFPKHQKLTFGLTRGRYDGLVGLSRPSILYPDIFEEILRIGDLYCPFEYTSIHLNHNVTCPPHKDTNNKTESMLISFGEYDGGNIVIENKIYNAKYTPIIFNGSKLTHWNTNNLQGNKYSLIFFS